MSIEACRTLSEHLDRALELSDEERQEWLDPLRDRETGHGSEAGRIAGGAGRGRLM
jgi:hypothetical protein